MERNYRLACGPSSSATGVCSSALSSAQRCATTENRPSSASGRQSAGSSAAGMSPAAMQSVLVPLSRSSTPSAATTDSTTVGSSPCCVATGLTSSMTPGAPLSHSPGLHERGAEVRGVDAARVGTPPIWRCPAQPDRPGVDGHQVFVFLGVTRHPQRARTPLLPGQWIEAAHWQASACPMGRQSDPRPCPR